MEAVTGQCLVVGVVVQHVSGQVILLGTVTSSLALQEHWTTINLSLKFQIRMHSTRSTGCFWVHLYAKGSSAAENWKRSRGMGKESELFFLRIDDCMT